MHSPHSQLFDGVLIIEKDYRGADRPFLDNRTIFGSVFFLSDKRGDNKTRVTDVLKAKTCSRLTSPLSEVVGMTLILRLPQFRSIESCVSSPFN